MTFLSTHAPSLPSVVHPSLEEMVAHSPFPLVNQRKQRGLNLQHSNLFVDCLTDWCLYHLHWSSDNQKQRGSQGRRSHREKQS